MTSTPERRSALSDDQRELLRSAVRNGYFEVPRKVTLADLAAANDMSEREASEQIRSSLDVLLRDAVLDG
ncbi:MAG TPA: helix-turn-helix domain-containing protein [Natrialbaceae archaeon]|nr:helix-turn-helix domain-containing protein [Natrialbaceae archaeon]